MKTQKKLSKWDVFVLWLGWFLIDFIPKSWGTKFDTRRYKIFKWCFDRFEKYIYWYVSKGIE